MRCARWVPRLFTIEQKQRREDVELKFELLPHAPYSPDLASSDYFLFPNLKKWLGGRRFTNNEESAVNGYFEEFNGSYYMLNRPSKLLNIAVKSVSS